MIDKRPFTALGQFRNDWLDARYHFSFSGYRDPARMGWGKLRVWNDDTIQPHTGFAPHGHRDMEIITYVRQGAITHRDSLGNEGRTEAGDVQVMSAGLGIEHAEMNREDTPTTLFQIWIEPASHGAAPYWDTRPFPKGDRGGHFVVLASGMAGDTDALPIRQDARLLGATLTAGQHLNYDLATGRYGYLVVAAGAVTLNGVALSARDAAAIHEEPNLTLIASEDAEVLLADVPA